MVLFMERAAAAAGADADAVVGDFAETGSDPVNRGDMALLIARLLDAATETVGTDDDGTFTVDENRAPTELRWNPPEAWTTWRGTSRTWTTTATSTSRWGRTAIPAQPPSTSSASCW